MEIRKRLFSRYASIVTDHDHPVVDVGSFAAKLLLFEKLIFESACLAEFPTLLRVFGFEGMVALLSSGAMDIQCEAVVTGQVGQSFLQKPKPLPLLSYGFAVLKANDRKQYIDHCLATLQWGDALSSDIVKVTGAIAERLIEPPAEFGHASFAQSKNEFASNAAIVKKAVAMVLNAKLNGAVRPADFALTLYQIGEDEFRAETDIGAKFTLSEIEVHKIVEQGLLGITSFNKKFDEMRRHDALAIFNDGDLPLLDEKLDFLVRQIDPEAQRRQLRRVLSITGLPDIERAAEDGRLNIPKLLEIRESQECRDFRNWLATADSASDREIEEQFSSLRARLSVAAHSTEGKAMRWLASTGLGIIPVAGAVLGAAAGLLDTFLVEKILPQNGPVTFLSRTYPSVFGDDPSHKS